MSRSYTIFWLAGESSGDMHAALVMNALNMQDSCEYHHVGIGGPLMQANGLKPLFDFRRFAIMGFVEVLKHMPFIMKVERRIKQLFTSNRPDLAILIDYPGLNLRIAHLADEHRIPVLYYICPQFWAWKSERVFKLKASVRHTACILPFEKELLDIHNVTSTYVGHPISEEVNIQMDREAFARFFALDASKQWLGFFPGSREAEIQRMLPVFLKAAQAWPHDRFEILVSKARSVNHQAYMDIFTLHQKRNFHIIDGYTYEMMKYCAALACTSGTVTLESAYIGTPSVICYKANPLSYLLGRYFVKIDRIGLPNIVLNQSLLPELVQASVSPDNINRQLSILIEPGEHRQAILASLSELKSRLSDPRPSEEMPKIVRHLLKTYA